MNRLVSISKAQDIFPQYQQTPIGLLLEFHNLNRELGTCTQAQLLVGMCIDNRNHLRIPNNFSFVIRAGGANLKNSEFKLSYAVAVGGIRHIAIIGHTNCGMVDLISRKEQFISGLVTNAGWGRERAEAHFTRLAPEFEIGNEIDFAISEAKRLRVKYPKITVAPMLFKVEDNQLYLIKEE